MKKILIVGGGPAGLMVAHQLLRSKSNVGITILDANKAVGRKFLVAGHGGFNLSNNRELDNFVSVYSHSFIKNAVSQFSNHDTVQWLSEIGIETYVGSSGKVFPKVGIKPIQVLEAWLRYLKMGGVAIHTRHRVIDFSSEIVKAQVGDHTVDFSFDYLVFALGGASWKSTGSDGKWTEIFKKKGISIVPFQASNAGIIINDWNKEFGGAILKNTKLKIGAEVRFGDIVLTEYGMEGAPVYALSHVVRKAENQIFLNFKPTLSPEILKKRLLAFNGSKSDFLHDLKLSKAAIKLFKHFSSKEDFISDDVFLSLIQHFPLSCLGLRPIDEVISTVGGVSMDEITVDFKLKKMDAVFCIGEMLDWDAPTGGYLLQSCFSSGFVCATAIASELED